LDKLRQNKLLILVLVIILCGIFVRAYDLTNTPKGYNQDEVSAAYEGFALLNNGTDRWGNPWPAYFLSWGSGQNVLLSYLDIPVFAAAGMTPLTVRLVPVILSILSLPLLFLVTKKLFGNKTGVIALVILTFAPWAIMAGRWGLESNLLPFFSLSGIYSLTKALENKRWIIPALIPWALALYAYSISLFFIPVILVVLAVCYRKQIKTTPGKWLCSILIFLVLAAPLILMALKNYVFKTDLPFEKYLPFSIPLFTADRIAQLPTGGLRAALSWDWRFFSSGFNDLSALNSFLNFPAFLPSYIMLPLVLLALFRLWKKRFAGRKTLTLLVSLLVSGIAIFALSLVTLVNSNRANALYLPLIMLSAYGILQFYELVKKYSLPFVRNSVIGVGIIAWMLFSSLFLYEYYGYYNQYSVNNNYPGLGDAIQAITVLSEQTDNTGQLPAVYISSIPKLNYMFVLFYDRVLPQDFLANAVITEKVTVQSYRNFYFNLTALPVTGKIYFLEQGWAPDFCTDTQVTGFFDTWVVGSCLRK